MTAMAPPALVAFLQGAQLAGSQMGTAAAIASTSFMRLADSSPSAASSADSSTTQGRLVNAARRCRPAATANWPASPEADLRDAPAMASRPG